MNNGQPVLMGIDLGTSSTKTVIVDLDGNLLAVAQQEYELQTPHPGWAEQSPETWHRAAAATMAQALDRSGLAPASIAAIFSMFRFPPLPSTCVPADCSGPRRLYVLSPPSVPYPILL